MVISRENGRLPSVFQRLAEQLIMTVTSDTLKNQLDLAGQLLAEDEPHQAFDICRTILSVDPHSWEALNLAGVAAFKAGLPDDAIELLHNSIFLEPNNAIAYCNLGNIFSELKQFCKARECYKKAIDCNPNYAEAYFNLGLLEYNSGNILEAIKTLQDTLKKKQNHALALHTLGNIYKDLGQLTASKISFQKAIKSDSKLAEARTNLASVLHELGDFKNALKRCQQAIQINPLSPEAKYNLGLTLQELGRHDEAIKIYTDVLLSFPKNAAAAMNIGYSWQQLGKLDSAKQNFEHAINIDPSFAQAYINLADLRLQQGKPEKALEICDTFLKKQPGNTAMLGFKTFALYDAGKPEKAKNLINFDRFIKTSFIEPPNSFSNLEEMNKALINHLESHPTLIFSPQSHATRDGYHSGELLTNSKGPFSNFEDVIRTALEHYKSSLIKPPHHLILCAEQRTSRISAWGVIMRSSSHQIPHIHPAAWLSGVYYAKVPDTISQSSDGEEGFLVFGKAPDHFHNKIESETFAIRPEEGLLVMFPSYFYHHTIPSRSNDLRVSIAFDLISS